MIRAHLLAVPNGGLYENAPPAGLPSSCSRYYYGGEENPLLGVQWANGDPLSSTDIGFQDIGSGEPTGVFAHASPGATSLELGQPYNDFNSKTVWVRHTRAGSFTAWVQGT